MSSARRKADAHLAQLQAELKVTTGEAAKELQRAKRAARTIILGDGVTPWEAAFEPEPEAATPEPGFKPWPKRRGK